MNNFKLLVDVHPFRNKNWHVTTGFYWGPSKVAKAENAVYDDVPRYLYRQHWPQ